MIKIILYDDKEETFKIITNIINRYMIKTEYEYRIEKFTKYCTDLENLIIYDNSEKIFLLDVEVPDVNGISLAAKIRKYDWNAVIIFLTMHESYRNKAFSERLMILDYVCKKNNYFELLNECIKTALVALDKNKNTLIYKFNSIVYRVPISDILYIVKVPLNKKCEIYTINKEKCEIAGTVGQVAEKLGPQFKQSHKSCIVNVQNIKRVDTCSNVITFRNGTSINLLSTRMKKGFEEYVLTYKL